MSAYVELSNVSKIYPTPQGPCRVVKEFSLNMREGEFVSLIGHSGCGKSTVLTMLAGLNEISEGGIIVANREVYGAGPDRGVVFQAPSLLPWMTAYENVMLGVERVFPTAAKAERKQIVEYYLAIVGLAESMHKRPRELSGGMQQRVGIARAFAIAPKMLLLDEPFGMLDSLTRMELQEVLLELLQRDSITALMVTHDVDEALFLSDRVVMMTNGPDAQVGDILTVPFERPRARHDVLEHSEYYNLRAHLIEFLEVQEQLRERGKQASTAGVAPAWSGGVSPTPASASGS